MRIALLIAALIASPVLALENSPPTISNVYPASGDPATDAMTMSGTVSDKGLVITIDASVNGATPILISSTKARTVNFSIPVQSLGLARGYNLVYLNAYDAAGNKSTLELIYYK